jgi:hypothetical protein
MKQNELIKTVITGGIFGLAVALVFAFIASTNTPTFRQVIVDYFSTPSFPFYGTLQYPINPFVSIIYGAIILIAYKSMKKQ